MDNVNVFPDKLRHRVYTDGRLLLEGKVDTSGGLQTLLLFDVSIELGNGEIVSIKPSLTEEQLRFVKTRFIDSYVKENPGV